MANRIRRAIRFIPKHINWFVDKRKEVKKYKVQKPIKIYNKFKELEKEWLEIEKEYHNKSKDERYWKIRGQIEILDWAITSEDIF